MGDLRQPDSFDNQLPFQNPLETPVQSRLEDRPVGQLPAGQLPAGDWNQALSAEQLRQQQTAGDKLPGLQIAAAERDAGQAAAPTEAKDQARPVGQLPAGDIKPAPVLDFRPQQQPAGDKPVNQQFKAGDQKVVPAAPNDQVQKPGDRPAAALKLEDAKTVQMVLSTIKELQGALGISAERMTKIEAELKKGEFGTETRKAYNAAARMLENHVLGNLTLLDSRGVEIPAGCPLEPPVDPRSGRHIMPEWFRAQLQNGDLKIKLGVADDKVPAAQDVALLRAAGIWSTRAMSVLESTIIHSNACRIESQIKEMNFEGRFNGWLPKKNMSDHEKEQWTYAAQSWMNQWIQVRNYAHSIAQLNVATRESTNPDKLFGITVPKWTSIAQQVFSDEALKDENFPGKVVRDETISNQLPSTYPRLSSVPARISNKCESWKNGWKSTVRK